MCIIFMVNVSIIECKWLVVDVVGKILGCFFIEVVFIFCGKYKLIYILYVDIGDYVIIINVEKIELIGKKLIDKIYYCYI